MRWLMLIGVGCALHAQANDAGSAVFGVWAEPRSLLEVQAADNGLRMNIIALLDPVYTTEEADVGVPGEARLDNNNPDPTLRDRPILGMNLISNYVFDGKEWRGDVYDPESGKTYSSIMTVSKKGQLKMRGYIGLPIVGRTAKFEPVSVCRPYIVQLLAMVDLPACEASAP